MGRSSTKITPDNLLPVGSCFAFDGLQRYEVISHDTRTARTSGATVDRMVWRSTCPDCSTPFETTSLVGSWPKQRRCDLHKSKGRPVTKDRTAETAARENYGFVPDTRDEFGRPYPEFNVTRRKMRGESEEAFAKRLAQIDDWEAACDLI